MIDTHRFFIGISDEVCDNIRHTLDAVWGYPTEDGMTITCFCPANALPHDDQNRPMLAVDAKFVEYPIVAAMLPDLLTNGSIQEISREQYESICFNQAKKRKIS